MADERNLDGRHMIGWALRAGSAWPGERLGISMPVRKMRQYLDSFGIKYVTISHSPAFTASETAHLAHVPEKDLAKVVMIKIDDRMAMAVLPASRVLDLDQLQIQTGAQEVRLANEREFNDLFADCESGAMPPFGNLYGIPVYADISLRQDEQIAFNAGSHSELVKMTYADFERLANPHVLDMSRPRLVTPSGEEGLWGRPVA